MVQGAPGTEAMLTKLPPVIRLTGIGWYFALSIAGGVVGGVLLDRWLGTAPLFTLLGLFGGLMAAFWGGYLLLMELLGRRERKKDGDET